MRVPDDRSKAGGPACRPDLGRKGTPMQRLAILAAGVLASVLASGCLTAAPELAMEGAGVIRGPKGLHREIQPVSSNPYARPLGEYQRFAMTRFEDDFGGHVPAVIFAYLPGYFNRYLQSNRIPNRPSGKTLIVSGKIIYYEEQKGFGTIISPLEEALARVELIDKDTGDVLGAAICVGRVTTRLQGTTLKRRLPDELDLLPGARSMAEGLGKAIADWIASRYPRQFQY